MSERSRPSRDETVAARVRLLRVDWSAWQRRGQRRGQGWLNGQAHCDYRWARISPATQQPLLTVEVHSLYVSTAVVANPFDEASR